MEIFPDSLSSLSGIFLKFEFDRKLMNWGQIITAINIIQPDFLKLLFSTNDAHVSEQAHGSDGGCNALTRITSSCAQKVNTTPEEVFSIKCFLKMSLDECVALQHYLKDIRKLLVLKMMKHFDLEYAKTLLSGHLFRKEKSQQELYCDVFKSEYFDTLSTSCVSFLLECLDAIVANLQNILHGSLVNWWKLYGEYLQLQRKLQDANFCLSSAKKFGIPSTTNDEIVPETVNNCYSVQNNTSSKFSSFFDNYFEGNKRRYREKLITDLSLEAQKLKVADTFLRKDYKHMAEEMSKFMTMKDTFLHSYCTVEIASNAALFC
mgnify:CR=1 FL=1